MIILLSPAKTLDFESEPSLMELPTKPPSLLDQSRELIKRLQGFSEAQLSELMGLSDKLSKLNVKRYQQWSGEGSKPAIYAFKGDVYQGLNAQSMSRELIDVAERRVLILSGLYGALSPLTQIEPHRLEMGTKLETKYGKNLYQFWGEIVTEEVNKALASNASQQVINLASKEYSKVIKSAKLNAKVITPVFKDEKGGQYKIISFFAKRARGLLTRHLLEVGGETTQNKQRDFESFTSAGYRFNPDGSTLEAPLFLRSEADRLQYS